MESPIVPEKDIGVEIIVSNTIGWLTRCAKELDYALRSSLENFGQFDYIDKEAKDAVRHVDVYPLYAISQMPIC